MLPAAGGRKLVGPIPQKPPAGFDSLSALYVSELESFVNGF